MNSFDGEVKRGKTYCLRLLSLRARSEKEIDDRLKGKGYGEGAIKSILDSLRQDGLVDDESFAGDWIDSRLRTNPRSGSALKAELKKKGIPERIIDKVLSEKYKELDDMSLAGDMVRKMIAETGQGPVKNLKGKLYQYLLRRGFDGETALEAVNKELGDDDNE